MAQIDFDNADRFMARHGRTVKRDEDTGFWHIFDGIRWRRDKKGNKVKVFATEVLRDIERQARELTDPDAFRRAIRNAELSGNITRKNAMLEEVESRVSVENSHWDKNPMILGLKNGYLDLVRGEFIEPDASQGITKGCRVEYDPEAECPEWEKSLNDWFPNNPEMIAYLQRCAGYSMTGDVSEQCCWGFVGNGANGKSLFLGTMRYILGDYALTMPFSAFEARQNDEVPIALAELPGVRFAVASETQENVRLNEGRIKGLTGESEMTTRFFREHYFRFQPQCKVFLAFNHRPHISDNSRGMWRRFKLIEFKESFEGDRQDKWLDRKLLREASGILNWALKGLKEWQRIGLAHPEQVEAAVRAYQKDCDVVGQFVEEVCTLDPAAYIVKRDLFAEFEYWCNINHINSSNSRFRIQNNGFYTRLESGYPKLRRAQKTIDGKREWIEVGITIAQEHRRVSAGGDFISIN